MDALALQLFRYVVAIAHEKHYTVGSCVASVPVSVQRSVEHEKRSKYTDFAMKLVHAFLAAGWRTHVSAHRYLTSRAKHR